MTPLGVNGKWYVYLDVLNQIQDVDNHTRDRIRGLFGGRKDLLQQQFPKWSVPTKGQPAQILSWVQEDAATAMQVACTEKGIWKSHERLRGMGAWPDGAGGVLLHCGDTLVRKDDTGADEWLEPGEIDGYVYPADAPGPRPARSVSDGGAAAREILDVLQTWRWARGETDAHLMFGWVVAAMFGGALDWRPMAWLTGGKGTGKSTLQDLISTVMGGEAGLLKASDASEAGIRSVIQRATMPIALDEAEAEEDNRRMQGVIKLARQAASGGLVLRGSADHKGAEFRVRSCFLFGSILIPPLLDQDISRIACLELQNFEPGAASPRIRGKKWREVGRRIRRQVFDAWPRLHETLESYRLMLTRSGHTARSADQYGTLLAMADMALFGAVPTGDELDGWAKRLDASEFRAQTDESDGWQRMLAHLFSQPLDAYRSGTKFTVGEVIAAAADIEGSSCSFDVREAQEQLRRNGIAVDGKGHRAEIVIANNHTGIERFFRETRWAQGVHRQDAKRIPAATTPKSPRSMARSSTRVTIFPVTSIPWFLERGTTVERSDHEPIPF